MFDPIFVKGLVDIFFITFPWASCYIVRQKEIEKLS